MLLWTQLYKFLCEPKSSVILGLHLGEDAIIILIPTAQRQTWNWGLSDLGWELPCSALSMQFMVVVYWNLAKEGKEIPEGHDTPIITSSKCWRKVWEASQVFSPREGSLNFEHKALFASVYQINVIYLAPCQVLRRNSKDGCDPSLTPSQGCGRVKELNLKNKTVKKILENNMGKYLYDLGLGWDFWNKTWQAQTMQGKDRWIWLH